MWCPCTSFPSADNTYTYKVFSWQGAFVSPCVKRMFSRMGG